MNANSIPKSYTDQSQDGTQSCFQDGSNKGSVETLESAFSQFRSLEAFVPPEESTIQELTTDLKNQFTAIPSNGNDQSDAILAAFEAWKEKLCQGEAWWDIANTSSYDNILKSSFLDNTIKYCYYVAAKLDTLPNWAIKPHRVEIMLRELNRIANMPEGNRVALELDLHYTILFDILDQYGPWNLHQVEAGIIKLSQLMSDALLSSTDSQFSRSFDEYRSKNPPNLKFTRFCREIWEYMKAFECSMSDWRFDRLKKNSCKYNLLIPALDVFQRAAYYDLWRCVVYIVPTDFPNDIAQIIYEYVLEAEQMGEENRILVEAVHVETGEVRIKCRFPCLHDRIPQGGDFPERCGYKREYGVFDKWEESPKSRR
ncbi:hypothetical protein B0J11DRAFT_101174 [Dendryphion nanum]|uniref:Uncharacterized protein n=1 Tax=Dendryphion nanum TaxID=256645 RepID=A0A9P9DDH5_9PLEO|nr:hypothetical protein B0J11DRAFT_101174 [Dendryphion nanum]